MSLIKKKHTVVIVDVTDPQTGKHVHKKINFVKDGCTLFFNAQHLMVQLNRGERALFDHLCEHMDSYNRISIDRSRKQAFREFLDSVSNHGISYADSSISKYTHELVVLGLLLKAAAGNSAAYIVNPKYVYRGSESARAGHIKSLVEQRVSQGLPIDKLIDRDIDSFFDRI